MNYSHVQFLSWELNTGPRITAQPGGLSAGYYLGFNRNMDQRIDTYSQCVDIDARVQFTANAISAAQQKIGKDDPSVLKVFMAPEFLYRGAGGAYLHDLVNGWVKQPDPTLGLAGTPYDKPWAGLFGGLQNIVAKDDYKNWLFVFGTAISASFPVLKGADGVSYLDLGKSSEMYNTALIQLGGAGNRSANYASRKHYISGIDFLNWYTGHTAHTTTSVLPADPGGVIPADVLGVPEGGAVFTIPGVNDNSGKPIPFGIEVCLDHACSGGNGVNAFGRIRTAGQYVKIQLVPSAGMKLKEASIRLLPAGAGPTPHSYAFNCDGWTDLNNPANYGSHTQIWNGSNGAVVPNVNKVVEGSNGAASAGTTIANVPATVPLSNIQVNATDLWTLGAGNVRITTTPLSL